MVAKFGPIIIGGLCHTLQRSNSHYVIIDLRLVTYRGHAFKRSYRRHCSSGSRSCLAFCDQAIASALAKVLGSGIGLSGPLFQSWRIDWGIVHPESSPLT